VGYVHGVWTDRWHTSLQLEDAVAQLERVPTTIGDWHSEAETTLSEREVEQAGFSGYISRRYKNRRNGASVNLLLACGRAGPMSVHTPEICYRGSGYDQVGPTVRHPEKDAELWKAVFNKVDAAPPLKLRVYWAWNNAGAWRAPANPRIAFGGSRALYKLYVIHEVVRGESDDDNSGLGFLRQALPVVDRALFAASPPG
jgi:hypothetical protein